MIRDLDLRTVRRLLRRHRRGLSATAAFLAVLVFGLGLRPADDPAMDGRPPIPSGLVEMPVTLADASVAASLEAGDVVDVVATGVTPSVITERAIVVAPVAAGTFASSSAAVVLALSRSAGLAIAGTQAPLTVLRHSR